MIKNKLVYAVLGSLLASSTSYAKTSNLPEPEYQLEQVVTLVRHGIRPQTNLSELNEATGKQWPSWSVPDGYLTQRGYDGIFNQSQYQVSEWKKSGLPLSLSQDNCTNQSQVFIWAAPDQRTKKTADAIASSISPSCHIEVGVSGYKHDPIFDALKMGSATASFDLIKKEFKNKIESQKTIQQKYEKVNEHLRTAVCAPDSCEFLDKDWKLKLNKNGQPKLSGPADEGSNIGETIRLQYSENFPLSQVAFGHVKSAEDVKKLMTLHDAKYKYLNEIPLFAQLGGSILYQQILDALDSNKVTDQKLHRPLVIFVGHDTNISEVKTLLGFNWQLPQYLANDIPPGGTLSFAKYKELKTGKDFVKISFSARTLDQWRQLTKLDTSHPLPEDTLKYPYCKTTPVGVLCPLNQFIQNAQKQIVRLDITQPLYK